MPTTQQRRKYISSLTVSTVDELFAQLQRITIQMAGKPSYDTADERDMIRLIQAEIKRRIEFHAQQRH